MSIWDIDFYYEDDKEEEEEYDIYGDYNWFANSFFTNHDIFELYHSWQIEKLGQDNSSSIDYFSIFRAFENIIRRGNITELIFKEFYDYYQELNPGKPSKLRRRVYGAKKYKHNRKKAVKKNKYDSERQQTTIAKKIPHSNSKDYRFSPHVTKADELPKLAELRNSAVRLPDNDNNNANRFEVSDHDDTDSSNVDATSGLQTIKQKEPLEEIIVADKTIKLVLEMPIMDKNDIKINAYKKRCNNSVEIFCYNQNTRYHRIISIPSNADIMLAKSTYNNGILEITFNKKETESKKEK